MSADSATSSFIPVYNVPHSDRASAMRTWRQLMEGDGGVFHSVHGDGVTFFSDVPASCLAPVAPVPQCSSPSSAGDGGARGAKGPAWPHKDARAIKGNIKLDIIRAHRESKCPPHARRHRANGRRRNAIGRL